jgi:hypothetical protein
MSQPTKTGGAKRGVGETRQLVKRYAKQGHSPRDIAKLLEVSTQAVYQHLHALRAAGELPPEEVAS